MRSHDHIDKGDIEVVYRFNCRSVGMECDFQTTTETKNEMYEKIQKHALEGHGLSTIPPDLWMKIHPKLRAD